VTGDVRRSIRAQHGGDARVTLGSRVAVRVINISMTGVLLETSDTADVARGDQLELTVPLGGAPFTATLQVGRQDRLRDDRKVARLRVGCAFVNMDPARREQLAKFLADGLIPPQGERRG
jgi:hypothetical protein